MPAALPAVMVEPPSKTGRSLASALQRGIGSRVLVGGHAPWWPAALRHFDRNDLIREVAGSESRGVASLTL